MGPPAASVSGTIVFWGAGASGIAGGGCVCCACAAGAKAKLRLNSALNADVFNTPDTLISRPTFSPGITGLSILRKNCAYTAHPGTPFNRPKAFQSVHPSDYQTRRIDSGLLTDTKQI